MMIEKWEEIDDRCVCVLWMLISLVEIFLEKKIFKFYKSSSSSSGNAVFCALSISSSNLRCHSSSIRTSGGANAGMATNSRFGSPTNFLANHKNGFSKL